MKLINVLAVSCLITSVSFAQVWVGAPSGGSAPAVNNYLGAATNNQDAQAFNQIYGAPAPILIQPGTSQATVDRQVAESQQNRLNNFSIFQGQRNYERELAEFKTGNAEADRAIMEILRNK